MPTRSPEHVGWSTIDNLSPTTANNETVRHHAQFTAFDTLSTGCGRNGARPRKRDIHATADYQTVARVEAERVLQLITDFSTLLDNLDTRLLLKTREILNDISKAVRKIKQIDREWGYFRGTAKVYVPYTIEHGTRLLPSLGGPRPPNSATIAAGVPCVAQAGLEGDPETPATPEAAAQLFLGSLHSNIAKSGLPLEAVPFPPSDPAATITVRVP
ncbi:hypothetical protein [Nocardia sp. NPDC060249]|uniref:hypothetical protein n=1 Tax=Nocardia sp. NPDC060249 TaxID=3347082 RepID=UPI003665F5E7